jgi:DNA-binding response OmpR family regulator
METSASILIVDDDPITLNYIKQILGPQGYHVQVARDGLEALDVLKSRLIDLIVSDIMMPRMNGYELHKHVVQNPHWVSIPVIFLTARALDSDIRYGKEIGVDDYLIKPVHPYDLLATVRGKLRRAQQLKNAPNQPNPLPLGDTQVSVLGKLRIDSGQYRVWLDGKPIKLSLKEFRLLECLARHPAQVVPMQELIQRTHALTTDLVDASALLRPLVRSVRRKLGYPAGDMGCIKSVRGVGYQLIPCRD